jgi:hypothetical protein
MKKNQIDINSTQEFIGHGHEPTEQVEGVQGREVEERQECIGRGIKTSSSLSHKTRAMKMCPHLTRNVRHRKGV